MFEPLHLMNCTCIEFAVNFEFFTNRFNAIRREKSSTNSADQYHLLRALFCLSHTNNASFGYLDISPRGNTTQFIDSILVNSSMNQLKDEKCLLDEKKNSSFGRFDSKTCKNK